MDLRSYLCRHCSADARRLVSLPGLALAVLALSGGCANPLRHDLEVFMLSEGSYVCLPRGPRRVDAIWERARALTGSDVAALDFLGSFAVAEGLKLNHPYNTGLSRDGMLEPDDKTGHFFAQAMWQYYDFRRPIPVAKLNGTLWEVVGEIRSWFGWGTGFNWKDVWANRLGREFGRSIHLRELHGGKSVVPSDVLAEAARFRPKQIPADAEEIPAGTAE